MKKSKIYLEYVPENQATLAYYVVTKLVNKLQPHVGSEISESEARNMQQNSLVDVIVTKKK